MRATITRYLETLKKRRSGDEGFSLIELIVVVAILGILVAIAIPVFGNIQETAKVNAVATIAANGATQVASQVAASPTGLGVGDMEFDTLETDTISLALTLEGGATVITIDNYCVAATDSTIADATKQTQTSGPAC